MDKEEWGNLTLQQAFSQINMFHDNSLNHKNKLFREKDGSLQDLRVAKRSMKLISAFKLIRNLPEKFDPIQHELLDDIANAFFNPKIEYEELIQQAKERAESQ